MQTLEMLEKKELVLLKKAAVELEKAKEFTRAKNKRGIDSSLSLTGIYHLIYITNVVCLFLLWWLFSGITMSKAKETF